MKALVVYYSRTGKTKLVGNMIAEALDADTEEIIDTANRNGFFGYIKAGRDAMRNKTTEIKDPVKKLDSYDLIFVGTPVWGWNLVPAVRTYMLKMDFKGKKIALFATADGASFDRTFSNLRELNKNGTFLGQKGFQKPTDDEATKNKVKEWLQSLEL